jgi:hypothetical protein
VTPPDFVIAAAEKEEHEDSGTRVCCHRHGCEKCAAKVAAAAHAESAPGKKSVLRLGFVLVDMARHCRNLPQFWSLFGLALPVRIETAWSFDETVVGRVVEAPVRECLIELPPPVPPPKLDHPADC